MSEVDIKTSGKRRLNLECGDDIWYLKSKTDDDRTNWLSYLEGSQKRALRAQRSGGVVARPKREATEPPSSPGGRRRSSDRRRSAAGAAAAGGSDTDGEGDSDDESDDEEPESVVGTLKRVPGAMLRMRVLTGIVLVLLAAAAGWLAKAGQKREAAAVLGGGVLVYAVFVAVRMSFKAKAKRS